MRNREKGISRREFNHFFFEKLCGVNTSGVNLPAMRIARADTAALRNTVGQLMAAIRLICIMEGNIEIVRKIKSCLSEDMTHVAHGRRLDRILKAHIDVLDGI
jgi:hypothetical protein